MVFFFCYLGTLVVSMVTGLYLCNSTLAVIEGQDEHARAWHRDNGLLTALVIIVASFRLEALAILRLRLRDFILLDMPMEDKHFHFIQYGGVYRYLIDDLPHIMVAASLLVTTYEDEVICGDHGHSWLINDLPPKTLAGLNLGSTAVFIFFGLVNKCGQRMAREARRQSNRQNELADITTSSFTVGGERAGD